MPKPNAHMAKAVANAIRNHRVNASEYPRVASLNDKLNKMIESHADFSEDITDLAKVVPELVRIPGLEPKEEKFIDLNQLDTLTLIRYTYMPFIIGEVAWDYADTCVNLAVFLREPYTKKACRNVRNLRKEYEWHRRKTYRQDCIEINEEKMIELQEIFKDVFGKIYFSFTSHIKAQFPDIQEDKAMLVASVCMAQAVIAAMRVYERIVKIDVEQKLDCKISKSVIPAHYTDLNTFLLGFLGEENPLGDERFLKEQEQVTKVLVDHILKLKLVLTEEGEEES